VEIHPKRKQDEDTPYDEGDMQLFPDMGNTDLFPIAQDLFPVTGNFYFHERSSKPTFRA